MVYNNIHLNAFYVVTYPLYALYVPLRVENEKRLEIIQSTFAAYTYFTITLCAWGIPTLLYLKYDDFYLNTIHLVYCVMVLELKFSVYFPRFLQYFLPTN